jgi:RNA polymerase sigma-70 factor, ECF subfamily
VNDAATWDPDALQPLTVALRAWVRRRVHDADAADDLVQDVLARFVRERASNGGPQRIAAWLFRAARNALVDRHRRRHREIAAGDLGDTWVEAGPSGADLDRLRAAFRSFVDELPPPAREALVLTEYEGLNQRQLAERLGVPLSTAKSRVQRARARLAAALHECCRFELDRRGGIVDFRRRDGRAPDCC